MSTPTASTSSSRTEDYEERNGGIPPNSPPNYSSIPGYQDVVRPFGYSSMECGYCKGQRAPLVNKQPTESSKSYGILAEKLTPKTYERFCYRGWRRSGVHLYKPANFESCCPTLTIRCDAQNFRPSKSQSKIARKLERLLRPSPTNGKPRVISSSTFCATPRPTQWDAFLRRSTDILPKLAGATRQAMIESGMILSNYEIPPIHYRARSSSKAEIRRQHIVLSSSACAQLAGQCKISPRELFVETVCTHVMRSLQTPPTSIKNLISVTSRSGHILVVLHFGPHEWQEASELDDSSAVSVDNDTQAAKKKSREFDKLDQWYRNTTGYDRLPEHQRKLRINTLPAHQSVLDPRVHALYIEYQHVVHQDPNPLHTNEETADFVNKTHGSRAEMKDSFNGSTGNVTDEGQVRGLLRDTLVAEIDRIDWGMYHPPWFKGKISEMLQAYLGPHPRHVQQALLESFLNFYQFLVESPLLPSDDLSEGTLHQQYWIGDVLIAVGVVDVLPNGVSSVYLFYQPEMSHSLVALGKVAILKEIEYTRDELGKPYYYLGYFIESCCKMRYKADYHPSHLLCPVYYEWVSCDVAIPRLRLTSRHVCSLVEDSTERKKDNKSVLDCEIQTMAMDIGADIPVTLDMLQENGKQLVRPILAQFYREAGPDLISQCLLNLT